MYAALFQLPFWFKDDSQLERFKVGLALGFEEIWCLKGLTLKCEHTTVGQFE